MERRRQTFGRRLPRFALSLFVTLAMVLGMCPTAGIAEEMAMEPEGEPVVEVKTEGNEAANQKKGNEEPALQAQGTQDNEGPALQAQADSYNLVVGGVPVTSDNMQDVLGDADGAGATVKFTPADPTASPATPATLTLNGATITGGDANPGINYSGEGALNIKLEGQNSVVVVSPLGIHSSNDKAEVTISGTGSLSVSVSGNGIDIAGSLTIVGGEMTANSSAGAGILAKGGITINGGIVEASGLDGLSAYDKNQLRVNNVNILGGTVTAYSTGANDGVAVFGVMNNAIAGTGWMDAAGTTGGVAIPVSGTIPDVVSYKRVQFPAVHIHNVGEGDNEHAITFQPWNKTDSLPSASDLTEGKGSYYLTNDVTLSGTWSVPAGEVNLCLNGKTITSTNVNADAIGIGSGATLSLFDEDGDVGSITGITGSDRSGVRVNGGSFSMYGGKITGNWRGVYNEGTFDLHGGKITENGDESDAAPSGAGVCNFSGTFRMHDGEISDNSTSSNGGGVYNGGTFELRGGKINGNSTTGNGGGVFVNGGAFSVSGDSMIQGNNTTGNGGGVFVNGGTFSVSGDPMIARNVKGGSFDPDSDLYVKGDGGSDGNVYLGSSRKITLTGALDHNASIGVTMANPGVFTESTDSIKASDYKAEFTSDDAAYVVKEEGTQLKLGSSPVSYMKWDDTEKKLVNMTGENACDDYTVVTASTTTFEGGKWYVVNANVSNGDDPIGRIAVTDGGTDPVHLILMDGAELKCRGITVTEGQTLNIYGQSAGTGALSISGVADNSAGIGGASGTGGTVNIHGGTVTATGGTSGAGIGGGWHGNGGTVNIHGGTVTATGGYDGAGIGSGDDGEVGDVTITGGIVKATGGTSPEAGFRPGIGGTDGGIEQHKEHYTDGLKVATTHAVFRSNREIKDDNKYDAEVSTQGKGVNDADVIEINVKERKRYMLVAPDILYPLIVGGRRVAEGNAGDVFGDRKVSFTPATNDKPATLTLNGYIYEGPGHAKAVDSSDHGQIGILHESTSPLTIVLQGKNSVTCGGDQDAIYYGIWTDGALTIKGTGSISASAERKGIYTKDDLEIASGEVEAIATGSGNDNAGIDAGDSDTGSEGVTIGSGITSVTAVGGDKAVLGKVKNAIDGMGWRDAAGTEGKEVIPASETLKELPYKTCKKVQFPTSVAKVTQAPTATNLTYNGKAQALVTAGTAEGGTMQYSLDGKAWSEKVSTATEPGTYTVWYRAAGDAQHADGEAESVTSTIVKSAIVPAAKGHVQNVGDVSGMASGKGVAVGTEGRGLRLESLSLALPKGTDGGIEYRGHIQNKGWSGWAANGKECGTRGRGLRLEALQVRLTGKLADTHSVWYRAHVQNLGTLGWSRDGQAAGTVGRGLRLEDLEVCVLPKGEVPEGGAGSQASFVGAVGGSAHSQNVGWRGASGSLSFGTTGRGLRLEALRLSAPALPEACGISYQAHVQNVGWQGVRTAGGVAGTTGRGLRVEAVRISLTGGGAKSYSVWYRVHSQNVGWLGWAHDGADAGTVGRGLRAEAVQVQVLPQGQVPAGYQAMGILPFASYEAKGSIPIAWHQPRTSSRA